MPKPHPDRIPPEPTLGPVGRPYADAKDAAAPGYGEPKGPRPPHYDRKPAEAITGGDPEAVPAPDVPRSETPERERDGFISGMTTPETLEHEPRNAVSEAMLTPEAGAARGDEPAGRPEPHAPRQPAPPRVPPRDGTA